QTKASPPPRPGVGDYRGNRPIAERLGRGAACREPIVGQSRPSDPSWADMNSWRVELGRRKLPQQLEFREEAHTGFGPPCKSPVFGCRGMPIDLRSLSVPDPI